MFVRPESEDGFSTIERVVYHAPANVVDGDYAEYEEFLDSLENHELE